MSKLKIAVVFGGRSGEHEVSLASAASVIKALDPEKYEVFEIGITKTGQWLSGKNCLWAFKNQDFSELKEVNLETNPNSTHKPDIIFPVLHGPFGEDGTIQGLFEMLQIPYVGCGVLASALAMDKLQCKAIWKAAGIPVVDYVGFTRKAWEIEKNIIREDILVNLGIPCFVKPANMGSSVGITKVKRIEDLDAAVELAANYDSRIVVEKGLNVREIECAVLGNEDPVASPVGEVIVGGEFYDFYDKYVNGVSTTEVPANLPEEVAKEIQKICVKGYRVLDCSGLSRVDCFIDKDDGKIYLNEINTMPGFTSISMYPKMMEAHGIEYPALVDRLIELGLERFKERQKNKVVFESGSDWFQK